MWADFSPLLVAQAVACYAPLPVNCLAQDRRGHRLIVLPVLRGTAEIYFRGWCVQLLAIGAALIAFLLQRLGSTTSEVAKGLNLDSGRVSVRLAQLAKAGEVKNTSHGYTIEPGARPGGHERALRRRHQGNEEMLFGVERGGRCGCHGAASSHRASWMFDGVWGEFLRREMMV